MGMNQKTIETFSVNAVRDSVVMSKYLDQFIPDNDKEPFWDGAVYVYENEEHTKANFKGRVSVQVKGTECSDLSKSEITFPVKITDLKAYLNDGGAIFFVVYISNNGLERKIYYNELTPIKIRIILDSAKSQNTKSIKFKEFPTDNDQKATIFFNCMQNCQKQSSFSDAQLFSLEELKEQGVLKNITIPISGINIKNDPQMALINNDVYLYANIEGATIPQPLKILPQDIHTHEEVNVSVKIAEKAFYDKIRIIKNSEDIKYVFGEGFTLTQNRKTSGIRINYKNPDDVRQISLDLDFMLSYIETGYFEIDGHKFPFDYDNVDYSKFNIDNQKAILDFCKKTTEVLDVFRCDKKLLISSLGDEDYRNAYRLYSSLIEKQPAKGLKKDLPFICLMKVGNLNFAIVLRKVDNEPESYYMEDFFGANVVAAYDGKNGEKLPMSPYAILKADDFVKVDNAKWELLLPSFKSIDKNEETFEMANWFLLDLLTAYDKCNNKNILNTAKDFAEWVSTAPDDDIPKAITTLNLLQVIKRMRNLNEDETKLLYSIIAEKDTQNSVMVGAYLLLEQQQLAEIYFDKMTPEEQNEFRKYPIFIFWKKDA